MEHGLLPGNLHYTEPNPHNASLVSGILQVTARSVPLTCTCYMSYVGIPLYGWL